ncbi:MAG: SDR family NAD(P)-dependent oxidoreductase [Verrucomicrobia bacterium]|nr:SDR family NAD(P)-dependent oxidoreductase [Verrucomicrobiota bacterium]
MRLEGKIALITGATGAIGKAVVERFLTEGATVIAVGRSSDKLNKLQSHHNLHRVVLDTSTLDSFIMGIQEVRNRFDKIDILVNNAGSSGPKQPIFKVPTTKQELEQLGETETVQDALESLLGLPWTLTCALLPNLVSGASIINISTIFSRTRYYGRSAYVVPKAGLNELSQILAQELGREPYCIRVNTVFPGPVASDRINAVFDVMDKLQQKMKGSTELDVSSKMLLGGDHFVAKEDVADTIIFLASQESRQFTGHKFEVTRGLQAPDDDTIELSSAPNPRIVDLDGHYTWIIGGYEKEAAVKLAKMHHDNNAKVLLSFRSREVMKDVQEQFKNDINFEVKYFDPTNNEEWRLILNRFKESMLFPTAIYVFPHHSPEQYNEEYGDSVSHIPLEKIQDFLVFELLDPIVTAKGLFQIINSTYAKRPVIVFVSNEHDGASNKFERIRCASISQLIRIWREEAGDASSQIWQLIRFHNREQNNLEFMTDAALSISAGIIKVPHINISICSETTKTPFGFTYNQKYHQMLHNLDGTVTILTGGSEGIGRETTRILVQGGSTVAIASRNEEKLAKTKKHLLKELAANGFPNADQRIHTTQVDVRDSASVQSMFEEILLKFGRVDFLVNNAGISGQEELVVDMSVDGWRSTLQANLLSNYDLIIRALPYMKRQKNGHIINVSSAFGGTSSASPPYPMRADYAVTKAGQRALAESLSHILGPEVKINTVAPGPVEGDRLWGNETKPGLYHRRALLNAEYGRINLLYNMCIDKWRKGEDVAEFMNKIGENSMGDEFFQKSKDSCSSNNHLLSLSMAEKLMKRLKQGKFLAEGFTFKGFQVPPEPFWSFEDINQAASRIVTRIVKSLALQKMPSEYDVGREIVFNLSGECMTGETLYPSCGIGFDMLQLAGDCVGNSNPTQCNIKSVLLIGNSMVEEMSKVANAFCAISPTINVFFSTDAEIPDLDSERIFFNHQNISPDIIVSFPNGPLPEGAADRWEELPSIQAFKEIAENHLTNHFIAAKRALQIDNCRHFMVTHPGYSPMSHVFSSFLNSCLFPLTVTLGQETLRLAHKACFFQINAEKNLAKELYQTKLVSVLLSLATSSEQSGNVITLR